MLGAWIQQNLSVFERATLVELWFPIITLLRVFFVFFLALVHKLGFKRTLFDFTWGVWFSELKLKFETLASKILVWESAGSGVALLTWWRRLHDLEMSFTRFDWANLVSPQAAVEYEREAVYAAKQYTRVCTTMFLCLIGCV